MPREDQIEKMTVLAGQIDGFTRSAQGAGKAIEMDGKVLKMVSKSGLA